MEVSGILRASNKAHTSLKEGPGFLEYKWTTLYLTGLLGLLNKITLIHLKYMLSVYSVPGTVLGFANS